MPIDKQLKPVVSVASASVWPQYPGRTDGYGSQIVSSLEMIGTAQPDRCCRHGLVADRVAAAALRAGSR